MTVTAIISAVILALGCGGSSAASSPPREAGSRIAARDLAADVARDRCAELERFFHAWDDGFTSAARAGGSAALAAFVATMFADSSEFVFKGTGGSAPKYSRAKYAEPSNPGDTARDAQFEYRSLAVSVGLTSSIEAVYVLRYVELDSTFRANPRSRPYSGTASGKVVRLPEGWRILHRVNLTDRTGVSDSAVAAAHMFWECR